MLYKTIGRTDGASCKDDFNFIRAKTRYPQKHSKQASLVNSSLTTSYVFSERSPSLVIDYSSLRSSPVCQSLGDKKHIRLIPLQEGNEASDVTERKFPAVRKVKYIQSKRPSIIENTKEIERLIENQRGIDDVVHKQKSTNELMRLAKVHLKTMNTEDIVYCTDGAVSLCEMIQRAMQGMRAEDFVRKLVELLLDKNKSIEQLSKKNTSLKMYKKDCSKLQEDLNSSKVQSQELGAQIANANKELKRVMAHEEELIKTKIELKKEKQIIEDLQKTLSDFKEKLENVINLYHSEKETFKRQSRKYYELTKEMKELEAENSSFKKFVINVSKDVDSQDMNDLATLESLIKKLKRNEKSAITNVFDVLEYKINNL